MIRSIAESAGICTPFPFPVNPLRWQPVAARMS